MPDSYINHAWHHLLSSPSPHQELFPSRKILFSLEICPSFLTPRPSPSLSVAVFLIVSFRRYSSIYYLLTSIPFSPFNSTPLTMPGVSQDYNNFHISVAATETPNLNSEKTTGNLAKIFSRFNLINMLTARSTIVCPTTQTDSNNDEYNEDPPSGNDGPDSHGSLIKKLSSVLTKMGSPIFNLQWSPVSSVHSDNPNGQGEGYSLQEGDIPGEKQQDLARGRGTNSGSRSMKKLASRFVDLKQSMFSRITGNENPPSNNSLAPNEVMGKADLGKDDTDLSQNQYSTALAAALAHLNVSEKPTQYYVYSKEKYIQKRNALEKQTAASKTLESPANVCEQETSLPNETSLRQELIVDHSSSPDESSDTIGWTLTASSNLSFSCVLCKNRK